MAQNYNLGNILSEYITDEYIDTLRNDRDALKAAIGSFIQDNKDMYDEETLDEFPELDYDPDSGMSEEEYMQWQKMMADNKSVDNEDNDDVSLIKASDDSDMSLSVKAIILEDYDADNDEDEHRFLIMRDAYSDYWDLPGGHVSEGETLEDALIREVNEETGLDIVSQEELFIKTLTLGDETKPVVFYFAEAKDPSVVELSEEHKSFEWITIDDIDDFNLGVFVSVIEEAFDTLEDSDF